MPKQGFAVRFTQQDRDALERVAGHLRVGAFIRSATREKLQRLQIQGELEALAEAHDEQDAQGQTP